MSEMIERVARAMFEADQLSDEAKLLEWSERWEMSKASYYNIARAALTAMRHPTEGMKGYAKHRLPGISRDTAHDVWMLMIDEALAK